MAPYLAEAQGDPAGALRLYRWNIQMSGALYEGLGAAEVFLRNAMDAQLRVWNAAQPPRQGVIYNHEWARNPAGPLWAILNPRRQNGPGRYSNYTDAYRRAQKDCDARPAGHRRHGHPIDHDDVVAHLTFGIWNKLLPSRNKQANPPTLRPAGQKRLWEEALKHAFPHHQNAPVVKFWVERLHAIRNRVAHVEPLLDGQPVSYHRTIVHLLHAIDPELRDWFTDSSRIPTVAKQRPTF